MTQGKEIICEECGAKYTCDWCGGTYFIEVPAGTMCQACSTLTAMGNAYFEHDYSKHRVHECFYCNKKFYSEDAMYDHMDEEHPHPAYNRRYYY